MDALFLNMTIDIEVLLYLWQRNKVTIWVRIYLENPNLQSNTEPSFLAILNRTAESDTYIDKKL